MGLVAERPVRIDDTAVTDISFSGSFLFWRGEQKSFWCRAAHRGRLCCLVVPK
nr:hypothetical protein [Acetobacter peroxydans]